MDKKIDKMHKMFGVEYGKECRTCGHLSGDKNQYRKCEVYGHTASEATDWRLSYVACGLYNKPYEGDVPIVALNKGGVKKGELQVPGQMSFLEV